MTLSYYKKEDRLLIAVDCIIFGFSENKLRILILNRDFEPARGSTSLIGGFVKKNEGLDEAAARILQELTGLKNVYLEQLYTYGDVGRDPGERVVSVAYFALLKIQELDHDHVKKYGAHWCEISACNRLIFDHDEMVDKALKRLRRRAKSQPIGFELVPKRFTIPKLQKLYEAIYQKKLDSRNFRKKLLAMDILIRYDRKDKSTSKKGAFLYSFDKEKYDQLLEEGFLFDL